MKFKEKVKYFLDISHYLYIFLIYININIVSPDGRGGVAHMVERSLRMREARGSIPRTSKLLIFELYYPDGLPFNFYFEQLR